MNIYKSSEEKYVKSVVLYANDSKVYHDAEFKKAVTKAELYEAFMVGVVVCTAEGTYVKAVKYVDNGAEAAIYADDAALSSVTPVED